jgi:hypothetical protein
MAIDSETIQGLKSYRYNKYYLQTINAVDKDELTKIRQALIEETLNTSIDSR